MSSRNNIDVNAIYELRQSGATLQQIGNKMGRTKERIRQILVENYGSSKCPLVSSYKLASMLGSSPRQILGLYQDGVIVPEFEFNTGNRHFLLWSPATMRHINAYYKERRLCKICHRPLTKGRWSYCSDECLSESHKYKYKSAEARQRQLISVKRYRDKRRRLEQVIAAGASRRQQLPALAVGVAVE